MKRMVLVLIGISICFCFISENKVQAKNQSSGITVIKDSQNVQTTDIDKQEDTEDKDNAINDMLNDVKYDDIQNVIDDLMKDAGSINFQEYVSSLASGENGLSFSNIGNRLSDVLFGEIVANKAVILQLIIISIIAAIFTNFANIFQNSQVSETAFYVTYVMLFSLLTSSFYFATSIATTVLDALMDFMKVLMPTYMLSIAVSAGAKTSLMYYESMLFMFSLIDLLLIKIVLPMINVYFVLTLANNISKEDMLSKLTELIEMIVQWILKSLLAIVIGLNAIQGLIIPMAEHVKNSAIIKSTAVIPGIGNAINAVSETLLGASVVVKNAIGVGGLIVIIVICTIPIIKLAFFVIVYKFGAAVVQPISDKRILGCIGAASGAAKLLLNTVFIAVLLFVISIALVAASTNLNL